jgi:23S rRNA (guanosine2251-2'-O)-methyltransferase
MSLRSLSSSTRIQDPHNLGAILRSADGAAAHGIIMPKDHSVDVTPAVFKASAAQPPMYPCAGHQPGAHMAELKEQGLWLVGSDEKAAKCTTSATSPGPSAW